MIIPKMIQMIKSAAIVLGSSGLICLTVIFLAPTIRSNSPGIQEVAQSNLSILSPVPFFLYLCLRKFYQEYLLLDFVGFIIGVALYRSILDIAFSTA